MGGLRERVRRRTRGEIADAALSLFLERGFDSVTVSEVAEAAGVSEKTVFNHFPTKAELVFDADLDLIAGLVAAIRERPVGCSILTAVRSHLREDLPDVGDDAGPEIRRRFQRMVTESPTLLAHRRQMTADYEERLGGVLAEQTGTPADAPENFLAAIALIGCLRAGFAGARLGGGRAAASGRALDLLETGFAEYGIRQDTTDAARGDDHEQ
jgi:AcrR family transcriptional regulator